MKLPFAFLYSIKDLYIGKEKPKINIPKERHLRSQVNQHVSH